MKEVCSCGASFKYDRPAAITWDTTVAAELLREWRRDHRHEMPEAEMEVPTVVESGSSHERQVNELGVTDRQPIGFRA